MEVEEKSRRRTSAVASYLERHVPKETVDRDDDATIILIIITSYYDYYYELQLPITVYKGVTILCNARVESGAANGGVTWIF